MKRENEQASKDDQKEKEEHSTTIRTWDVFGVSSESRHRGSIGRSDLDDPARSRVVDEILRKYRTKHELKDRPRARRKDTSAAAAMAADPYNHDLGISHPM